MYCISIGYGLRIAINRAQNARVLCTGDQRQVGGFAAQGLLCQPGKGDCFQIVAVHTEGVGCLYAAVRQKGSKAAEQGDADTQYILAVAYEAGEVVPVSQANALKWYKAAAEGGNVKAMERLGVVYGQVGLG